MKLKARKSAIIFDKYNISTILLLAFAIMLIIAIWIWYGYKNQQLEEQTYMNCANTHKRNKNPVHAPDAARALSHINFAAKNVNFYETGLRTGRSQRYDFCLRPKRKVSNRGSNIFDI
jgi:magnesium-transporting ATPase (P-type)